MVVASPEGAETTSTREERCEMEMSDLVNSDLIKKQRQQRERNREREREMCELE